MESFEQLLERQRCAEIKRDEEKKLLDKQRDTEEQRGRMGQ
jgi:hypothetical protein